MQRGQGGRAGEGGMALALAHRERAGRPLSAVVAAPVSDGLLSGEMPSPASAMAAMTLNGIRCLDG